MFKLAKKDMLFLCYTVKANFTDYLPIWNSINIIQFNNKDITTKYHHRIEDLSRRLNCKHLVFTKCLKKRHSIFTNTLHNEVTLYKNQESHSVSFLSLLLQTFPKICKQNTRDKCQCMITYKNLFNQEYKSCKKENTSPGTP